ncbi:MAG: phosphoglycerate mutase family protein [Desulfobacterales bacterium]|nr:phosphoglycerate mutase family protein [Desulfobacterales bacterium]
MYFARHGQSTWNAQDRWAGHDDPPLTDLGREQAKNACAQLAQYNFEGITSSSLLRARETASIISHVLNIDLKDPIPELNEIDAGNISGLTSDQINANYPDLIDKWKAGFPVDMPGGESWEDFVERVFDGILQFKPYSKSSILVIAHEGVLRALAYQLGEKLISYENLEGRWYDPSV